MTSPTPPAAASHARAADDLAAELGLTAAPRPWWRRATPWLAVALLLLVGLGLLAWQARARAAAVPSFVTEPARRGDLSLAVTANGTLQPTRSVSVGSELSGTVARVRVDVNDPVRKGQVIVELDTSKLRDQVTRSRATLAAAKASVAQAVATVKEQQANLARLEEVARLSGGKVPSATELDSARATLERAQAEEASARANVADAQAALSSDETNLAKASIRSPIDGVVLSRAVEPGQAVAASLQAVTLLTLAEDLTKMMLQVNVDEADVGAVQKGQRATFTVSAYPNRKYPATITRVAYGSTTTDNVVTYTTDMDVGNDDRSLRPGMTATATIASTERHDALLVPNTALRFAPATPDEGKAPAGGGGLMAKLMPRPPGLGGGARRSAATGAGSDGATRGAAGKGAVASPSQRTLWVLREGRPEAVAVQTGVTDGRLTEITGGALQDGMAVITDQRSASGR